MPVANQPLVLLVDDDDHFRAMFGDALRLDGMRIVEASSGESALAMLEAARKKPGSRPDLIVLDLMMPRMSGLEVLQRLRRGPAGGGIPILVVTAVNDRMLPVRLDLPVAYKVDVDSLRQIVRDQLARAEAPAAGGAGL